MAATVTASPVNSDSQANFAWETFTVTFDGTGGGTITPTNIKAIYEVTNQSLNAAGNAATFNLSGFVPGAATLTLANGTNTASYLVTIKGYL